MKMTKCNCLTGACFARNNGSCVILNKEIVGKCPFQKPIRNVTNGIIYTNKYRKEGDD